MSAPDYSKEHFFDFIDYVSKKGLIKQATASNWKNAALRVLANIDDHESEDLRSLDIDLLFTRFANLEGKSMTPASLQVYKSRVKTAIGDFVSYADNPMAYKPGISQRTAKNGKGNSSKKNIEKESTDERSTDPTKENITQQSFAQGQEGITFPIPLRPGVIVEVKNLPMDLTQQEAEKISMVIKALAMSGDL